MIIWQFLKPFITAPITWLSILFIILISVKRIQLHRRQFRLAIEERWLEVRRFFSGGLLGGLLLSIISLAIGFWLTPEWLISYQIAAFLGLLIFWLGFPIQFTVYLTPVVMWILNELGYLKLTISPALIRETLVIGLLLTVMLNLLQNKQETPAKIKILDSHRGQKTARLTLQQLYLVPTIILLPQQQGSLMSEWWPTLTLQGQSYQLVLVPFLLGYYCYANKHLLKPSMAYQVKLRWQLILVGTLLVGLSMYQVTWSRYLLIALVVLAVANLGRYRLFQKKGSAIYTKAYSGLKVLAVLPNTPAAKMAIQPSDTIISCNQIPVNSHQDLHEAIALEPTYCRLNVQDVNDEIRLVQSAIYIDDPHEIGLIMFPDEK